MGEDSDIDEAVLRPMQALCPAPHHLRGDPAALGLALATYRRALSRFDRRTLEAGWQRSAEQNELWCWPKVADLVRACEHCRREGLRRGAGDGPDPRIEEAAALTHAYTRRFMERSQLARRARAGGWEAPLRRYVDACAWIQAQCLAGVEDVGYNSAILFGPALRGAEREGAVRELFERAREQAAKGHIRVHVPAATIRAWELASRGAGSRGR